MKLALGRIGINFINILHELFCQYPFAKKSRSQKVTREKLVEALSYKKFVCKMLIELTLGVIFINVLHAHFLFESVFLLPKSFAKAKM
jgi:hypothetical protein